MKKLISLIFRDFIFNPKCLPTAQRSLIRHPRAIFLAPSSLQILKSIFSHLPDRTFRSPRAHARKTCCLSTGLAVLQAPQRSRHPACPGVPWERSASQISRITKGFMARSRRTPATLPGRCSWELSGREPQRKLKRSQTRRMTPATTRPVVRNLVTTNLTTNLVPDRTFRSPRAHARKTFCRRSTTRREGRSESIGANHLSDEPVFASNGSSRIRKQKPTDPD